MMSRRLATASLVALCLTMPLPAFAKAKPKPPPPACNLITDIADDAQPGGVGVAPQASDPALDVLSADVAGDSKQLTLVWRVKKLSNDPSLSATGRRYLFNFSVGPQVAGLQVSTGPVATNGEVNSKVVFDPATNEIRMTVPFDKIFGAKVTKGAVLRNLQVHTDAGITGQNLYFPYLFVAPVDSAISAKTYVVGSPSCVAVGK